VILTEEAHPIVVLVPLPGTLLPRLSLSHANKIIILILSRRCPTLLYRSSILQRSFLICLLRLTLS
jgi:hypothetical protein